MTTDSTYKTSTVLGLHFLNEPLERCIDAALQGGLVTVPSGPGLSTLQKDAVYQKALINSDWILTDSGLMVLLWKLLKREQLHRVSGYRFLAFLLKRPELQNPRASFWVIPSLHELEADLNWLHTQGIPVSKDQCYVAPMYPKKGAIVDDVLADRLRDQKPQYIIICIGGGQQEKLGSYLKHQLPDKPTIICTGAAIGFLSGTQAKIPLWIDELKLGWLFRIIQSPRKFLMRYIKAFTLVPLLIKYKDKRPPIK